MSFQFVDFWENFNTTHNFFIMLLANSPNQLIFHSIFGNNVNNLISDPANVNVRTVLVNGEAPTNLKKFKSDIILTCTKHINNTTYFPIWLLFVDWWGQHVNQSIYTNPDPIPVSLLTRSIVSNETRKKNRFCAFVVSNGTVTERNAIFTELSKYKRVDSAGKFMNNLGYVLADTFAEKVNFLKNYKFCICYENKSISGYTTEKILHALVAGCVPIYWGDPHVTDHFNKDAFINANNMKDIDQIIDKIIEIDTNNDVYNKMIEAPILTTGTPHYYKYLHFLKQRLLNPLLVDKVYVINHPSLKNRRQQVESQMNKHGILYQIIGTDYDDITHQQYYNSSQEEMQKRVTSMNWTSRKLTMSEQNLAINHIKCWENAEGNTDGCFGLNTIMIFEDDVVLCDNFVDKMNSYIKNLPADWDIVYFGTGCNLRVANAVENVSFYKVHNGQSKCTDSLLLNMNCIRKMTKHFCLPIDWELWYQSKINSFNVYWCEPTLTNQNSQILRNSSIQIAPIM